MVRKKEIYTNELKSKISKLWLKNPEEWKQYHTLRDFLKQFPEFKKLSERTIMRYLSQLVKIGFLEKKVELSHRTWYKPKQVEFHKVILKDRIEKLEDSKLLQTLNTFSLIFLKEYYKRRKNQKVEPEFFEVVEAATKQLLKLRKAQALIRGALQKIETGKKENVEEVLSCE